MVLDGINGITVLAYWAVKHIGNEVNHVDEFGVPRTREDTASRDVKMAFCICRSLGFLFHLT